MKITVFEGSKGDCLLLKSTDGKNVLVDGGNVGGSGGDSYSRNVAPYLGRMRKNGEHLDLVCVSHIDQDHIGGILRMLNDHFAWRVYDHQKAQGLSARKPTNPRPPEIAGIWHNAFHEQVSQNRRSIYNAIAAAAPESMVLGLSPQSHGNDLLMEIASSMNEAAKVSRRIGANQLNIPLNKEFNGKLVRHKRNAAPIRLGRFKITIAGPTGAKLNELREKWDDWLVSEKGRRQINKVAGKARIDEDALRNGQLVSFFEQANLGPAIGNRESVTEENVASIVMMVEEQGKTLLTTGDARDDDIVDGLIKTGFSDSKGHVHVNALKVQHHGSENNFSAGFAKRVTADHYIICGNGSHDNPDLRFVSNLLDSRLGSSSERSPNPETGNKFKLWFTSDSTTHRANKSHMKKVASLVKRYQRRSGGQMTYHFSNKSYFSFNL